MGLPKNVLVATDFSEFSERAGELALELAGVAGARVHWIHAVEISLESDPLFRGTQTQSPVDQATRLADIKLGAWQLRATEQGLQSDAQCVRGGPAEVVAQAAELEADLIVVGTHGHTGVKHALLGSVAERIVRDAGCSVLVARGDRPLLGGRPIVLGDDLAPAGGSARELATALAEAKDLPLHVVHTIDVGIPYLATLELMLPRKMIESLYADAREQLDVIARDFPSVRVQNETISSERPADALCETATRSDAALVVVGSHSRKGVERLLLGSTAERVVRHAPCSVLIAR